MKLSMCFAAIVTWAEQLLEGIKQQLNTETLQRMAAEIESVLNFEAAPAPEPIVVVPDASQDAGPGKFEP